MIMNGVGATGPLEYDYCLIMIGVIKKFFMSIYVLVSITLIIK